MVDFFQYTSLGTQRENLRTFLSTTHLDSTTELQVIAYSPNVIERAPHINIRCFIIHTHERIVLENLQYPWKSSTTTTSNYQSSKPGRCPGSTAKFGLQPEFSSYRCYL